MRQRLRPSVRRLQHCAFSMRGDSYWIDGGGVGWSVMVAGGGAITVAAAEAEATGRAVVVVVVAVVDVALLLMDARR